MGKKHLVDPANEFGGINLPTIDKNGDLVTPNAETLSFLSTWISALARQQEELPGDAELLRRVLGFSETEGIFNAAAVLPDFARITYHTELLQMVDQSILFEALDEEEDDEDDQDDEDDEDDEGELELEPDNDTGC